MDCDYHVYANRQPNEHRDKQTDNWSNATNSSQRITAQPLAGKYRIGGVQQLLQNAGNSKGNGKQNDFLSQGAMKHIYTVGFLAFRRSAHAAFPFNCHVPLPIVLFHTKINNTTLFISTSPLDIQEASTTALPSMQAPTEKPRRLRTAPPELGLSFLNPNLEMRFISRQGENQL